jgi:hypothetical protein
MRRQVLSVCVVLTFLEGCLQLTVPEQLSIACDPQDDLCPDGQACSGQLRRCIAIERADTTAPQVTTAILEAPVGDRAGPGQTVTVRLGFDEPLGLPPTLVLGPHRVAADAAIDDDDVVPSDFSAQITSVVGEGVALEATGRFSTPGQVVRAVVLDEGQVQRAQLGVSVDGDDVIIVEDQRRRRQERVIGDDGKLIFKEAAADVYFLVADEASERIARQFKAGLSPKLILELGEEDPLVVESVVSDLLSKGVAELLG